VEQWRLSAVCVRLESRTDWIWSLTGRRGRVVNRDGCFCPAATLDGLGLLRLVDPLDLLDPLTFFETGSGRWEIEVSVCLP
jgi:hypothetical protein